MNKATNFFYRPDVTFHTYRAVLITIVALLMAVTFVLIERSGSIFTGSLTNIGVKGGRTVTQMTFDLGEVSEVLHQDHLTIVITPDVQDISHGAPLSSAFSAEKRVFGYKYSSRDAALEIAAAARAENGEPLTYSELFPGKFFASEAERNAETFIADFEAQKNITFLPLSAVTLEKNARYVVVTLNTDTAFRVRGLEWCGDGLVRAPEVCDDGKNDNNDGCDGDCSIESGYLCSGEPSVCTPMPMSFVCGDAFMDTRDSASYATVLIRGQCWMAQNMNVGTKITGNEQGISCENIQKYCYNHSDAHCTMYGGLYQWDQAMCGSSTAGAQGICPVGWHIPTHFEWTTLELAICSHQRCAIDFPYDYITIGYRGGSDQETLKSDSPSGFNGLLAGLRYPITPQYPNGLFHDLGMKAIFWSSSLKLETNEAWNRGLASTITAIYRYPEPKSRSFSVRCLKD